MAYTKHTWVNGETIFAEGMNNMEDGIAAADTAASGSVRFDETQTLTSTQQSQARNNIEAAKATVSDHTLVIE